MTLLRSTRRVALRPMSQAVRKTVQYSERDIKVAFSFLNTSSAGSAAPKATVLLAHGAGAPMDSTAMTAIAEALAQYDMQVLRFEFAYMAQRREGGARKPPPRADRLMPEYLAAVVAVEAAAPLIIAGKSMGGRVASMIADAVFAEGRIAGLLCIGYPFHPPKKPEHLRTAHMEGLQTPTLICQGTRDPFGTVDEVAHYPLSPAIALRWFEDGDHDLKPRKRGTGLTAVDHKAALGQGVSDWVDQRLL